MDGAPVLLRSESPYALACEARGGLAPRSKSSLHAFALSRLPALERNVAARENQELLAKLLFASGASPLILNVGGKHGSAMAASLRGDARLDCVEADVVLGAQTAVVCDPQDLPFEDESFDAVLADAVLEHMVDPDRVAGEIHRVLRPGGVVYSDVPFLLAVHGGRYDFERFSASGHRRLFRGFEEIASGVSAGPGAALANALQAFLLSFVVSRPSRFAVKGLCRLTLFWLKYLDVLLVRRPGAADAALGTYFIGRKAAVEASAREIIAGYRGATPDLFELR